MIIWRKEGVNYSEGSSYQTETADTVPPSVYWGKISIENVIQNYVFRPTSTHPIYFMCCPSVAHIVDLNIGTSCDHHPDIRESNVLAPVVCLNSSVVHISVGTVSQTSLTQVASQSDAGSFATGHGCLLRCHSLALTGRACHTPSSSWYPYLSVCHQKW